jgi:hypothetical protein
MLTPEYAPLRPPSHCGVALEDRVDYFLGFSEPRDFTRQLLVPAEHVRALPNGTNSSTAPWGHGLGDLIGTLDSFPECIEGVVEGLFGPKVQEDLLD